MRPLHPEKEALTLESPEFLEMIKTLPNEYQAVLEQVMEGEREEKERRQRVLSFIQEALSQIRLDMNYLMFDLDATRRERDDYLKRLEQRR